MPFPIDEVAKRSASGLVSRIAGLAFILIIVDALSTLIFVDSKILVSGDMTGTINNIRANEMLFRTGVFGNIVMFLLVVVLAATLYHLLESVDRNLATVALLLRFGEAVIGAVGMMLSGLVPLLLVNGSTVIEPDLLQSLVSLFLAVEDITIDVVLIFMGVGGIIFSYLFLKGRLVPKVLSLWGIAAYATMLTIGSTRIFYPTLPESVFMSLSAPAILFEIVFGFWLLIKGVNPRAESPGTIR